MSHTNGQPPTCIDLAGRYGDRYRVKYEESYWAERRIKGRHEPWLLILLCQHGHIYPHGGDMLAAATDKRGGVAKKLAELGCTTVVQDGADGINATFHVDDFELVAELMKPKKRRKGRPMTDEQKQQFAEMGREVLRKRREATCQSDSAAQFRPQTASAASESAQAARA